jgi:hypothetical protein
VDASDSARWIARALAGLFTVVTPRAWKTSCALVPPESGKSCFTWFSAVCDCEPGIVNVLSSWPPPSFMPAPAPASTRTHIASTSHR